MFGEDSGGRVKPLDAVGSVGIDLNEIPLGSMSMTELLTMRSKIDGLLPPMRMEEMDLEEEVVRQYMTVKSLQGDTLAGNDEPNKKASVVNACAAALQQLAKLQTDVYTAERFKRIENLLIKHIKLLPKETADAFIKDYSQLVMDLES